MCNSGVSSDWIWLISFFFFLGKSDSTWPWQGWPFLELCFHFQISSYRLDNLLVCSMICARNIMIHFTCNFYRYFLNSFNFFSFFLLIKNGTVISRHVVFRLRMLQFPLVLSWPSILKHVSFRSFFLFSSLNNWNFDFIKSTYGNQIN